MFGNLDSFPLLAIPLFIFAGEIMSRGGIARRLIDLIFSLIGAFVDRSALRRSDRLPLLAPCRAPASPASLPSALTIPALVKNGYGRNFSVSLITATGVIDVIIPPSITMIIYGVAAQQSVALLFLAGDRACGSS